MLKIALYRKEKVLERMNYMSNNMLEIQLKLIDEKVKFAANARTNPEIVIDYFPPFGTAEGYTSLELFLISFASCVSTTIVTLIRGKMLKTISGISAKATGIVRETHPKAISKIQLDLVIESGDVEDTDIQKALAVSEEKLCPVWAMIKGNVEVEIKYTIQR